MWEWLSDCVLEICDVDNGYEEGEQIILYLEHNCSQHDHSVGNCWRVVCNEKSKLNLQPLMELLRVGSAINLSQFWKYESCLFLRLLWLWRSHGPFIIWEWLNGRDCRLCWHWNHRWWLQRKKRVVCFCTVCWRRSVCAHWWLLLWCIYHRRRW